MLKTFCVKKKKPHKVQQEQTWLPQGRWVCSWGARRTRLSWQNGRCSAPFWSLARRPSTCGSTGRFLPACLAGYTWEKMNKEKQLKKGWVLHADKLSLTLSSIAGSKYLEMRAFPFNIELNSIKNCDKHILGNISDYDCLLCVESRRLTPWGVIRHPLLSTNSWWHTKCILWQIVQCFTLDFFFLPKKKWTYCCCSPDMNSLCLSFVQGGTLACPHHPSTLPLLPSQLHRLAVTRTRNRNEQGTASRIPGLMGMRIGKATPESGGWWGGSAQQGHS